MARYPYRNNYRRTYATTSVSDGRDPNVCTLPQEKLIRSVVAFLTDHIDKAPQSLQQAVETLVDGIPVEGWLSSFEADPTSIPKADARIILDRLVPTKELLANDDTVKAAIAAAEAAKYPGIPSGYIRVFPARFDKECSVCGAHVSEGVDPVAEFPGRRFVNYCQACASSDPAEAQAKADAEYQARLDEALRHPGLHLADNKVWRVDADGVHARRFGPYFRPVQSFPALNADTLLTGDRATAYAAQHGCCIACNESIGHGTERRSLAVGYGPVCAKRYGWRYPSKDEAEAILARLGR